MGQFDPEHLFANVVLLEHSHAHWLHIIYGSLHTSYAELISCYRNHVARKVSIIQLLVFYGKILSTPDVVYRPHFRKESMILGKRRSFFFIPPGKLDFIISSCFFHCH